METVKKEPYYTKLDSDIINELKKIDNVSAWLNQLIAQNLKSKPLIKHILHVNGERVTVYAERDLMQIELKFTSR